MIRELGLGTQRLTVTAHKGKDLARQIGELVQGLIHGGSQAIKRCEVLQVRGLLFDLLPQELNRVEVW